jgi:6-pyruvoyltetrahydropterin/6-carboxytetrahydropterin synthase
MKEKFTSSKTYRNLPCAHRQWRHKGHCAYIHGYSRQYTFYFEANEMDEHGWLVGFGDLKNLNKYLIEMYDHTMIIAEDDPELETFQELHNNRLCDLRVVPEVSLEGSARTALQKANDILLEMTKGRARCFKVEARENDKNSAIYELK